jgi:hypothetical protein
MSCLNIKWNITSISMVLTDEFTQIIVHLFQLGTIHS